MATIVTRAGKGSPLTNQELDSNFSNLNTDKAELSGAAFTGAITTNSTIDGRDVAADGVTADAALPKSGGAMTGAITTNSTFDGRDVATDGTKLDGVEASADVTDTANVTAAGALMDSELTSIASVKALNQGVATGDSPTFVDVTATSLDISGNIDVDGTTNLDVVDIDGAVDMASTLTVASTITGQKLVSTNGVLELDDNGSHNGVINSPASLRINIDSDNNNTGESFQVGHSQTSIDANNVLLKIEESGAATFNDLINIGGSSLNFTKADGVGINAKESLAITIDSDNNDSSRVFSILDGNGTTLMQITDGGESTFHQGAVFNEAGVDSDFRVESNNLASALFLDGGTGKVTMQGATTTIGSAVASTNVEFNLNGVASKAQRIQFQESGVNRWLLGQGAASETTAFELYNSTGTIALSVNRSTNAATFASDVTTGGSVNISGSASGAEQFRVGNSTGGTDFGITVTENSGVILNSAEGSTARSMTFSTGGSPKMTLTSGGDVLVGKTSNDSGTATGAILGSSGVSRLTADGSHPLVLKRKSSDGTILQLEKDGSIVGSIGSRGGEFIAVGSGDTNLEFNFGSDQINPSSGTAARDNAINLGSTGARFKDLYLSGGVRNVNGDGFNAGTEGGEPILIPADTSGALNGQGSLGHPSYRWKDAYLSGGVYLGGTGAANKLDDYEEGTWTPTGAGVTLGSALGTYTKVGRVVTVNWLFAYPTTSSGSQTYIANLPFSAGTSYTNGGSHGYVNGSAAVSTSHITSTSTSLLFRTPNGGVLLTHADFSGAIVRGTYTYQTS